MAKFQLEKKFFAPDGVTLVRLYANEGKNGINLGATMRKPGERAQTGWQDTVQTEEQAKIAFEERVRLTLEKGYTPRGGSGMIGRRNSFKELPPIPGAVYPAAEATPPPVSEEVVTAEEFKDSLEPPVGPVIETSPEPELVAAGIASGQVADIKSTKSNRRR